MTYRNKLKRVSVESDTHDGMHVAVQFEEPMPNEPSTLVMLLGGKPVQYPLFCYRPQIEGDPYREAIGVPLGEPTTWFVLVLFGEDRADRLIELADSVGNECRVVPDFN